MDLADPQRAVRAGGLVRCGSRPAPAGSRSRWTAPGR